ncbi:MAG: serine hydrolase [Bacteroidetes bacterium]|nr:serine hydrolase [Bacteroidota bacterium]
MKIFTLLVLLLFIFNGSKSFAQEAYNSNKPKTLTELKNSIQKILKETKTPGAGVVLVSGDETIMLEGFGKADIEKNIAVNENTMFRLGSVSKVYVALAILKLQEEGRLSLKDKIKDLIPEIKFYNPWEDKHPIRIENLLEHTTGWSYWHFAELGSDDPKPKTLKEALDFYPKSRTSKFIPGTRIQYSNVGTSVAAYIIEKVSGLTFEDYIDKNFFKPMGIENMTYLQTEQYKKSGAKLYENGVKLNYYNILYRPSAALNGSPKDMVKMIKFFINRGRINNNQLISDSSLNRMERSESLSLLSKYEIFKGCGLSNFANYFNGFIYHGHGGSLPGGNADFAYLPEYNMGYAVMINGGDEDAVNKIASLIKYYQTKDLVLKPVAIDHKKYKITIDPSGYYTIINPKFELTGFFERIKYVQKVWFKNDTLYSKRLMDGNSMTKYIPIGNNEFRSANAERSELALINDPLDGNLICIHAYLKKISPFWAYTLISMFYVFFIILISTIIFGLLRTLVYLFGKKKNKTALWVCIWPLITDSFIFVVALSIFLTAKTRYDYFHLFGTANIISVIILVCSICYALASVWSAYYIFKNRRVKMSKIFYFHSALAAILNLIFMLYFLSNGLIGIPIWI